MGKKEDLTCGPKRGHDRNRYGKCWRCERRRERAAAKNKARRTKYVDGLPSIIAALEARIETLEAALAAKT